jgi:TM2 domain-containing membrane protein YozV
MNIDVNEISKKSNGIAIIYLLTFGIFGAHRFYAGKWKTGLINLLVGTQFTVIKLLTLFGINIFKSVVYSIISLLFLCAFLAYDLYAMATEMFSDSQGKILLGGKHKEELIGRSPQEKLDDRVNIIMSLLIFVIVAIFVFIILPLVASYA